MININFPAVSFASQKPVAKRIQKIAVVNTEPQKLCSQPFYYPVNFTSRVQNLDKITNKDIQFIKRICDKAHYSKSDLINNPDQYNFKVTPCVHTKGTVYNCSLHNFYTPDNDINRYQGICEELAYKTGKRIQSLTDDYLVYRTGGNLNYYDMTHAALIVFKNTSANKEKLEQLLIKLKEKKEEKDDVGGIGGEAEFFIEEEQQRRKALLVDIKKDINDIQTQIEDIGGLYIDPSFNEIGPFKFNYKNHQNDYENKNLGITALESFKRIIEDEPSDRSMLGGIVILGYALELAPELKGMVEKDSLLAVHFDRDYEKIQNALGNKIILPVDGSDIKLYVMNKDGKRLKNDDKLEAQLRPDSKLKLFLDKIREDLGITL